MKYKICFLSVSLFFLFNLQAQSLEDAAKLYKEKKYEAAGIIYYDLYLFDKAVDAFEKQIEAINKLRKPDVEALQLAKSSLEKAERAARMISRCEDVRIIDSVIVDKARFLDAFRLSEEAGKLIPASESIIYENQLNDKRYSAKKTSDGSLHLFTQTLIGNNWGEEKQLNIPVEEPGQDNYPFVMPDGLTIYYASTGNGSIGGYDIFVTRYNLSSDSYLAPNQLGMPFNSICNDYMLAIDEEYEIGYFVSDRFQSENKVVVYTFIPNDSYVSLEDLSDDELINRAKITSIKDSWEPGVNYTAYMNEIAKEIERKSQIGKRDFRFPINDNIIYYTLDDFDSDAAKKSFVKYNDLKKSLDKLESELEGQRKNYGSLNKSQKNQLRTSILTNEKKVEELSSQIGKLEKDIRNQEIKYLRQHQ